MTETPVKDAIALVSHLSAKDVIPIMQSNRKYAVVALVISGVFVLHGLHGIARQWSVYQLASTIAREEASK